MRLISTLLTSAYFLAGFELLAGDLDHSRALEDIILEWRNSDSIVSLDADSIQDVESLSWNHQIAAYSATQRKQWLEKAASLPTLSKLGAASFLFWQASRPPKPETCEKQFGQLTHRLNLGLAFGSLLWAGHDIYSAIALNGRDLEWEWFEREARQKQIVKANGFDPNSKDKWLSNRLLNIQLQPLMDQLQIDLKGHMFLLSPQDLGPKNFQTGEMNYSYILIFPEEAAQDSYSLNSSIVVRFEFHNYKWRFDRAKKVSILNALDRQAWSSLFEYSGSMDELKLKRIETGQLEELFTKEGPFVDYP